jgi:CobQ-like glutamine amidotransferase family enzyme
LGRDGSLGSRTANGATVFAVCAGLQILGHSFAVQGGDDFDGLGLIDLVTRRGDHRRVGDLLVRSGANQIVGFENHGGLTELGTVAALGEVTVGYGNEGATDGVRVRGYIGTYAHGPVLALNPWLADELLTVALGRELEPLATVADRLHDERCRQVAQGDSRRP